MVSIIEHLVFLGRYDMQIEELEDCRVNPCLVASDRVVRKILTQRRGNLEWSTGLGGVGGS